MDHNLIVEQRSQYGATVIYPINDQAIKIAQLLGSKTIPMAKVAQLKSLGFIFVVQSKTVEL
jgi:hypothetical protein